MLWYGTVYSPHALGMQSGVNCQNSLPIAHRKVTCTSYHAHGVRVQITKPHLCHAPTYMHFASMAKPFMDEPTQDQAGVEGRHPVLDTRDTAVDLHSALIGIRVKVQNTAIMVLNSSVVHLQTQCVFDSPSCESIPQRAHSSPPNLEGRVESERSTGEPRSHLKEQDLL